MMPKFCDKKETQIRNVTCSQNSDFNHFYAKFKLYFIEFSSFSKDKGHTNKFTNLCTVHKHC